MARTITIGATAPALRIYIADDGGPVDLESGVTSLVLESLGPEEFTGALTPDAGQDQPAPDDGLTGVGWCSISPPSTLDAGRYALKVGVTTAEGVEFYPAEGYEVLDVEPGRRTFAALSDVARRMGRELTAAEEDQTLYLLAAATDLIADAVGRDGTWAAQLEPIPPALRIITVEAVVRLLFNPRGAQTTQETLGSYSHSETFSQNGANATSGLMLTVAEERRARQAVFGAGAGSVRVRSVLHDVATARGLLIEDDEQARLAR